MKKVMVAVVALGVTLGAWAEDPTYVLESGQSDTQTADAETDVRYSSILVNGDLTVGGKMWMRGPNGSPGTLTMTGGTITVSTSTAGLGFSHGGSTRPEGVLDATFEPDDNGVFPKVTIVNGATSTFKTSGTSHWNFGVRTLYVGKNHTTATSADGYIDLFDLQKNGSLAFYQMHNYTSLTGRLSVAGTCLLSKGGSYNSTGVFTKGAWQIDMAEGSALTISVGNQKGWLNAVGASVGFEGTGDVKFSQRVNENGPYKINPGAKFNQSGKVIFFSDSGTAYYQINDGTVFGPGISTVSAGNTNVKIEVPSGIDLKVPNVALASYVGCGFFGAGTLSIDATEQDRTFSAEIPNAIGSPVKKTETPNEITIVKLGEKDLTISASTNFISLKLNGGTTHVKNSTRIQSLVCDGGTFVPDDGVTVVVEEGLSTLTGKLVGPDGGDWPRGEHLICYYKGEDPTGLSAEVRFGDKATFAAEEVTDGEYAGYKALMLTVEYTGKTIHLTENDAEIDLCELMGGSLSVPCDVIIDAGVTNYNTTALTGIYPLTVTGGGVLVLNASSPDYTGEVYIGNASVRVTTDQPFGTGKVTIAGYVGAGKKTSRIQFANTEEITIPNELEIVDSGENAVFSSLKGAKKVTFTGAVVARTGLRISDGHSTSTSTAIYWSFQDTVDVDAGLLYLEGYGSMELCAKSTAPTLYAQGGGSPAGKPQIHLYSSDNVIGCIQSRWEGAIFAEAENAWGGGRISDNTGYAMTFSLKTYDQVMKYINAGIYTGTSMSTEAQIVADDPGATLTLTGTTSSQTTHRMRLNGSVSLVLDSANTGFVQTFKGGTSTTKGSITAKSGTLAFTDDIDKTGKQKLLSTNYVSLVNVPELNVTGGAIRISPIRDGIFAGVTNLTVSAGSFAVEGPGQEPFGPLASTKAIASLSGSGTMAIADGLTVSVKCLKVDGQFVDAGRYTGEGGPSDATVLPQLTGTGVLAVRRSGLGMCILLR